MAWRIVPVLIGFVLGCLAAGLTLVLFVYTPAELAGLSSDVNAERMSEAGLFALVITPHIATFAALPALIGVIFGEVRKIGSWAFYALIGIAIAAIGFLTQHLSEAPGQVTILHNYALTAFLTAGLVGGLVYWLFAGRFVARPVLARPASPEAPAGDTPPAAVPEKL